MNEYIGAVHIHSTFSDGTGKVNEIAEIASDVGLDFIILTDHNTLRAKNEGYEKFYDNTFLLVGCEINDKENKNHYIAVGIDEPPSTRLPAKEYVNQVKKAGGIGFLAHPHEKRDSLPEHPPYPWTAWDVNEYTGIEIWNHMSEWMEGLTEENKYQSFVHPLRTIQAPPKETLEFWDTVSLEKHVTGIGGIDAHAHKVNFLGFFDLEVFPYKVLFKSIRTHILTDEKIKADNSDQNIASTKKIILKSLEKGLCFVSNYYHSNASGFRYFCEGNDRIYQMGETVPFGESVTLRVILPGVTAKIDLLHNGKICSSTESYEAEFKVSKKGIYRVEISIDGKAWIFSNHIRLGI